MSVTKLRDKTIYTLWGRAGGFCQICGEPLAKDSHTKKLKHRGYVAHIYGEKPNAARYHEEFSSRYCDDVNHLLLLCNSCHKRIDIDEPENFPVSLLLKIKNEHELKVEKIAPIFKKQNSMAITLRAKVGDYNPLPFDENMLLDAILNINKCPQEKSPISLLDILSLDDSNPIYWDYAKNALIEEFKNKINNRNDVTHWSLFAIAPQPILILLGSLFTEIKDLEIYQKHREEKTWIWPVNNNDDILFKVKEPDNPSLENIAIKFSLSDSVSDSRVTNILGESTSIWEITIDNPNRNFVKNSKIQQSFKNCLEKVLNDIHLKSPDAECINLFPAVPQSIAICIGQVRMPKAQKPYVVYDENNKAGKFIKTITIN